VFWVLPAAKLPPGSAGGGFDAA